MVLNKAWAIKYSYVISYISGFLIAILGIPRETSRMEYILFLANIYGGVNFQGLFRLKIILRKNSGKHFEFQSVCFLHSQEIFGKRFPVHCYFEQTITNYSLQRSFRNCYWRSCSFQFQKFLRKTFISGKVVGINFTRMDFSFSKVEEQLSLEQFE